MTLNVTPKVEFVIGVILGAIDVVLTYFYVSSSGLMDLFISLLYTCSGFVLSAAIYHQYHEDRRKLWGYFGLLVLTYALVLPMTMKGVLHCRDTERWLNAILQSR